MIKNKPFIAVMLFVIIAAALSCGGTSRDSLSDRTARSVERPELTFESAEPAPEVSRTPATRAQPQRREPTEEGADTATMPRGPGVIMVKLTPGDVEPSPGITVTLHQIELPPSATFSAYDLRTRREVPKVDTVFATAEMGDDGEYEFTGLPLGRYALLTTGDDVYGNAFTALTKRDPEREVKVVLYEGAEISGVVRNSVGEGIEGAMVYISSNVGPSDRQGMGLFGGVNVQYLREAHLEAYDSNNDPPLESGPLGPRMSPYRAVLGAASRTKSDLNGNYVLSNLRYRRGDGVSWEYQIIARAEGYAPKTMPHVVADTDNWDIVLSQGGTVSGEVVDTDSGQPMPSITVRVASEGVVDQFDHVDVATDDEGRFYVATLSPGEHTAQMIHDELIAKDGAAKFTIREGEETTGVRLDVALGGSVSGRLYDANTGLGLAGETIRAWRRDEFYFPVIYSQETDSAGYYSVRGLPAETYYISRDDIDDYPSRERKIVTVRLGEEVPGVDFPLSGRRQFAQVSGTVTDWEGNPVAQATVEVLPSRRDTKTQSDGSFTVGGVTPGAESYLLARKPEQGLAHAQVGPLTVPEEGLSTVEIVMEMGASIEGVIVDQNGNPVSGASVSARSTTERPFASPAAVLVTLAGGMHDLDPATDQDGRYEIPGLPDGIYEVTARRSGYNDASETGIHAGSTSVDFVLQALVRIEGQVLDARTREPITHFSVEHHSTGAFTLQRIKGSTLYHHYVEGRFAIDDVPEGEVTLAAWAQGYAPGTTVVSRRAPGETAPDVVVIALEPGATVEGMVTDRNGDPIANAKIFVDKSSVLAYSTRYGAFTLDSLPPGPGTILASHESYGPGSTSVNLQSNRVTQVEIVLSQGGEVEGVVTNAGKPVPSQEVAIEFPRAGGDGFEAKAKTDANGAYHFTGLPEGAATLTAYIQGKRQPPEPVIRGITYFRRVQVFVQNGRVTVADIDIPPVEAPATIEGVVYLDENTPVEAIVRAFIHAADGNEMVEFSYPGPDGYFLLDGLPAGSVVLRAKLPGYPNRVLTFDIQEGEQLRRDITFGGDAAITVTLANLPVDAQRTRIIAHHGVVDFPDLPPPLEVMYRVVARADVRGETASLTGLEAGTYTILALFNPAGAEDALANRRWVSTVVTIEEPGQQLNVVLTF